MPRIDLASLKGELIDAVALYDIAVLPKDQKRVCDTIDEWRELIEIAEAHNGIKGLGDNFMSFAKLKQEMEEVVLLIDGEHIPFPKHYYCRSLFQLKSKTRNNFWLKVIKWTIFFIGGVLLFLVMKR